MRSGTAGRTATSWSWASAAGGPPARPAWRASRRSSGTPPTTPCCGDALLENLHRSQLNPLEEAAAYDQLLDDFGCTHDELARRIGRSRPADLQHPAAAAAARRPCSAGSPPACCRAGHARALLGLDDADAQERLAHRIVAEGLSVRAVEEIVALGVTSTQRPRQPPPQARG